MNNPNSLIANHFLTKTNADRIRQISHQLKLDNLKTVGLWLENAEEFACMLLACLNAKVTLLLPPNLLDENLHWLSQQGAVLFDRDKFRNYAQSSTSESNLLPLNFDNESEIWLKTSGSSGESKILKKTAKQMWCEAEALATVLPFNADKETKVIGSVSLQHLYGLTFRIFLPLYMGWQLGEEQLHYPEYLLAESKHHKTIWISSPALLSNLNLNALNEKLQIIGVISSGGALAEHTSSSLREKLPCPLIEIYGSTETGVIAYRQQAGLWAPMPDSQIGLNEQGALWVENPWISQREQTADAVILNAQGFELLGRIDKIVKLGDKRVSLVKIEQDLLTHPYVKDCYVALHPDYSRAVAWIALTPTGASQFRRLGRKNFIQQLRMHLSRTQEKFALPRYWRFSLSLPRNAQSKISRIDFEQVCRQTTEEHF